MPSHRTCLPRSRKRSDLARGLCFVALALAPSITVNVRNAAASDVQEKAACAEAAELGQEHRRNGKLRDALESFRRCARRTCPTVVTADCLRFAADVEHSLPSLVFRARDEGKDVTDVTVFVDGEKVVESLDGMARELDPGTHEVRFEREGRSAVVETVVLVEGEKSRLLTATFSEVSPGPPTAVWVLGGLGAASIAGFAYLGLSARSDREDLEATCGVTKSCTDDQVAGFRRKAVMADVFLGIGIVSLATAGVLWMGTGQPDPAKGGVDVDVQADGGMLRWRGVF